MGKKRGRPSLSLPVISLFRQILLELPQGDLSAGYLRPVWELLLAEGEHHGGEVVRGGLGGNGRSRSPHGLPQR